MTEENKKENIKAELERASRTLRDADLLFRDGSVLGAVSRLYYSLLYAVRALLLTKGLEPKSHEGVLRVFASHFVKEGVFQRQDSHLFAKLMKYREEADYSPAFVFSEEDFERLRAEAQDLSERIRSYLKEKGYL